MTTAIDTPQTDADDANLVADHTEAADAVETAGGAPASTSGDDAAPDTDGPPKTGIEAARVPSDEPSAAQQADDGEALADDAPAIDTPSTAAEPRRESITTAPGSAPGDCGALLKKTFPALFAGGPKPLKLRIQVDIQERAPGVFSKQALSAFFRRYTGSTSYLIAVSRAKTRFDLDGAPAGELSDEHRKIAVDELARRRGNNEARAALEEQQRRNRATLLHDFERTTLAPANFCALKGIGVDELEGYLATARREAAERPQNPRAFNVDQDSRRPSAPHRQPASRPDPRHAGGAKQAPRRR